MLDRAGLRDPAGEDDDDIVRQRPQVQWIVSHQGDAPAREAVGE